MSKITNTIRLALLATTISAGLLSVASAQTTPVPAPPQTPMPPIVTALAPDTFFNGKLLPANWLASDAMDKSVYNLQQEKIGEVNNLIIDGDGRVVAAVVGIGGFLGMGEKDVAITYKAIQVSRNSDGKTTLMLDVTKEALKAAPTYKSITTTTKRS